MAKPKSREERETLAALQSLNDAATQAESQPTDPFASAVPPPRMPSAREAAQPTRPLSPAEAAAIAIAASEADAHTSGASASAASGTRPHAAVSKPNLANAGAETSGPTQYRCPHCGYRLIWQSGLRCSECGRAWSRLRLDYWFDCATRTRFERVLRMVRLVVVVQVLAGLTILNDASAPALIGCAVAGYLLWIMHRAHAGSSKGDWAMIGVICCAAGCASLFLNTRGDAGMWWMMLGAAGVCLLLSVGGQEDLRGARWVRWIGFAALGALPIAPTVVALAGTARIDIWMLILPFQVPMTCLFIWGLAWFWLAQIYRRLYRERAGERPATGVK